MEISKGLQLEIQSVQSKLKNAIRDHQICVGKLKDDPNNPDILDRIQEIQVHIVSLGRCQKQVVQRLRKEVDDFKAVNANEVKVSVASLLGLNNNNHITADNESRNNDISEVRVVTNGLDNVRLAAAKEDYEEIVRNGDVTSHRENLLKKERSISVETLSADDEEIIEVSVDENTRENKRQMSEEPLDKRRIKCTEQLSFLEVLGLITTLRSTELQNRRAERKRRSTANPQFVYSNWEMPTKRKRHNYLQSAGNVPQTRQTTARLNGPSPPPICNKSGNSIVPPKSTSPPTRTMTKSLIPMQKATTRPNILRNMSESRVFPNKVTKMENGNGQLPLTCTTTKTSQSTTNSKTVHIPGLPSGLTIERIENDSAVCINCRNPGTLTNCDNCEANYHVSCHSVSPPPPRLCPKCALKTKEVTSTIKKNDELAAASYAPGVVGKPGEDPEIDKASSGFYKIGTITRQQSVTAERGVNELSGTASFVIPVATNTIAAAPDIAIKSDGNVALLDDTTIKIVELNGEPTSGITNIGNFAYSAPIVVNDQLSRSSVTCVPQSDSDAVVFAYEWPKTEAKKSENETRTFNEYNCQQGKVIEHKFIPGIVESRKDISPFPIADSTGKQLNKQLAGRLAESFVVRGTKKSTTRAIPGLTRIVQSSDNKLSIPSDHGNNDNMDELQSFSYNGGSTIFTNEQKREARTYGTKDSRTGDNDIIADGCGKYDKHEITGERKNENQTESLFSRGKFRPKSGGVLHSLFTGYNKPDNFADRNDRSKQYAGTSSGGTCTVDIHGGKDNSSKCSIDQSTLGDQSQCSKIVSSAEHVKLEEAHLSAPSRAKLMTNYNEETLTRRINDSSRRFNVVNRLLPNRRRTTEDRETTNTLVRASYDLSKIEHRQTPRILARAERNSLDSRITMKNENYVEHFEPSEFSSFHRNYSNSFVRLPIKANDLVEIESTSGTDNSATDDASSPISMHDGNLKIVVTNDREKNAIGTNDLTTTENNETNEDNDSGDNLEVDEGTEDNEEDIEEEEDQDCPIVDEEIREGGNKTLRIALTGTVSPESMQVLEQFESAMLQVENGDKTANP